MSVKKLIEDAYNQAESKVDFINEVKSILYELSPMKVNPVDRVLWIPKEKVVANDYNPNHVAPNELKLLYTSIKEDGYTQPIVTIYDDEKEKYIIVDGFHRSLIERKFADIDKLNQGLLPIVVMNKTRDQRMASTVRHNRARGSHSVDGMVNIIYSMMRDGRTEREICKELGMEPQEFSKLKYITGFAKIFKNYEYSAAIDKNITYDALDAKVDEHNESNEN